MAKTRKKVKKKPTANSSECVCCICGCTIENPYESNNPYPVRKASYDITATTGRCCNACNELYVINFRLFIATSTTELTPVGLARIQSMDEIELLEILSNINYVSKDFYNAVKASRGIL